RNVKDNKTSESQKIQTKLAILEKLKDSPKILKFYNILKVVNYQVMVFEWAEHGTFQELYNDLTTQTEDRNFKYACYNLSYTSKINCLNEIMASKKLKEPPKNSMRYIFKSFAKSGSFLSLLPDETIDFDGSKPQPQPIELPEMIMNFNFPKIMPFEEDIKAYKKKDYNTA
ncbi:19333_t:CDS:2, partial [Cetraspora pellucida]